MQWFHFKCIGMKTEPSDAWYCSTCNGGPNSGSGCTENDGGHKDKYEDRGDNVACGRET